MDGDWLSFAFPVQTRVRQSPKVLCAIFVFDGLDGDFRSVCVRVLA